MPCYPRPRKVIFDNGNEYKKDFLPLLKGFSIKLTPTTINNHQSKTILERVHQVLVSMLRTKNLTKYDFDDMDPWISLLDLVACAIYRAHHTTLQAIPDKLVFGKDMP